MLKTLYAHLTTLLSFFHPSSGHKHTGSENDGPILVWFGVEPIEPHAGQVWIGEDQIPRIRNEINSAWIINAGSGHLGIVGLFMTDESGDCEPIETDELDINYELDENGDIMPSQNLFQVSVLNELEPSLE
jgi:hypothetical protein